MAQVMNKDGQWIQKRHLFKGKTQEQKWVLNYFLGKASKSKDAQYEAYVASQIAGIDFYSKALYAIGVDEDELKEISPVTFENFEFDNAFRMLKKKPEIVINPQTNKKFKKPVWVTSRYRVVWIFFSDKQVFISQCDLNTDDGTLNETTDEYFYKDITAFKATNKTKQLMTPQGAMNVNVNEFEIVVPGATFSCRIKDNVDMAGIIQGMRQKLREKKTV